MACIPVQSRLQPQLLQCQCGVSGVVNTDTEGIETDAARSFCANPRPLPPIILLLHFLVNFQGVERVPRVSTAILRPHKRFAPPAIFARAAFASRANRARFPSAVPRRVRHGPTARQVNTRLLIRYQPATVSAKLVPRARLVRSLMPPSASIGVRVALDTTLQRLQRSLPIVCAREWVV